MPEKIKGNICNLIKQLWGIRWTPLGLSLQNWIKNVKKRALQSQLQLIVQYEINVPCCRGLGRSRLEGLKRCANRWVVEYHFLGFEDSVLQGLQQFLTVVCGRTTWHEWYLQVFSSLQKTWIYCQTPHSMCNACSVCNFRRHCPWKRTLLTQVTSYECLATAEKQLRMVK